MAQLEVKRLYRSLTEVVQLGIHKEVLWGQEWLPSSFRTDGTTILTQLAVIDLGSFFCSQTN